MVANKNWGEVIEITACNRTMIDSPQAYTSVMKPFLVVEHPKGNFDELACILPFLLINPKCGYVVI